MNTFVAKKIGEVLAFARLGTDTLKKGEKGFKEAFSENDLADAAKTFKELGKKLAAIAAEQGTEKETEEKAAKTEKKVAEMRDLYIGENWDEASELLEWMGFYAGASLVHWKLVSGAADAMEFEELATVSRQAIGFYDGLFATDEENLKKIGAEKAGK